MGGSLSEPATLADLGSCTFQLFSDPSLQRHLKLSVPGVPFHKVLIGMQHVDDILVVSKVHCQSCLEAALLVLFPADVGMSLEEAGQCVRLLSCNIVVQHDTAVITPHNPNADFALGLAAFQKSARLGHFFLVQSYTDLRTFMWGKQLRYNSILCGNIEHADEPLALLLAEISALLWPTVWIQKACVHLPRRHQSYFLRLVRHVGYDFHKLPAFVGFNALLAHVAKHSALLHQRA